MERQCPHCDYDMAGLPSDRCPECGREYDARLAMRRAVARRRDGLEFTDVLLMLPILATSNVRDWQSLVWIVPPAGAWVYLRRAGIRRRPFALWLALLALLCADSLDDAGRAPAWVVGTLIAAAAVIAFVETVRFGWRAPGAVMRAAGAYSAVASAILAVFMGVGAATGRGPEVFYFLTVRIDTDGRLRQAGVCGALLLIAAIGFGLWRAGLWVSGLERQPGKALALIAVSRRRRGCERQSCGSGERICVRAGGATVNSADPLIHQAASPQPGEEAPAGARRLELEPPA